MKASKIILGNAPSSGSTLLVGMIGSNQDIYQTRELNIYDKPDWISGREENLKERWLRFSRVKYDKHFPCEQSSMFNGFHSIPDFSDTEFDYTTFASNILVNVAAESGCSTYVEKTPNNIFSMPYLYQRLPDAKFVIIVRHPVSVYKSLKRRGFDTYTAIARWYFPNLVAWEMAKLSRVHIVSYEHLTNSPEDAIGRLESFLGIDIPRESISQREARDIKPDDVWSKDLHGRIVPDELDSVLPDEAAAVFRHLRANKYFFEYTGIDESSISPLDLASKFEYDLVSGTATTRRMAKKAFPALRYMRYIASCIKHRRQIRPLWHEWS